MLIIELDNNNICIYDKLNVRIFLFNVIVR